VIRANSAVRRLGAALLGMMAPWITTASSSEEGRSQRRPGVALRQHRPMILHERHGSMASSENWSGYAVTGAGGSVTDVKASWVVPAIQGTCPSQTQYASFWVGIDGYSSSTVEQIGTDSDCSNGSPSYYAWYEFYPKFPYTVFNVSPGDIISAEVSYSGGKFTVSITDTNPQTKTHQSWSTSEKEPNAKRTSAEWIIEASGGVPLANFGTVNFGQDSTGVSLTCDATVGNSSGPIGSAAFAANLVTITMVTSNGTKMSVPSAISMDETSFADAWKSAGP
jgi:Peptidase A4 family